MRATALFAFFVAHAFFVASVARAQAPETIAEIRVHGNHTTPDAEVLSIAGLSVGESAAPDRLEQAERALRSSQRFEGAEVRRRFRSVENPSEILVILFVDEHPAVDETDLTPGPLRRLKFASMWLPVLSYADGSGFTYGGRVSFVDVLGGRSRVSVPLTWGGERRVAAELERSFNGPVSLLRGAVSTYRRVNPHFDQPDTRVEGRVEAERAWTAWLRTGATARVAHVDFGGNDSRHSAIGFNATLDTRIDPSFPRNAIHARVGWERLMFTDMAQSTPNSQPPTPNDHSSRFVADVKGYVGIGGSAVLALRGQFAGSGSSLPEWEQSLLGGSDSLRGYRAGHRAGDNLAAFSAEARLPLNSPLSAGRLGVKAFVDAGTTWMHGSRLSDQPFERGIGGGVYFGAAVFVADLDVAKPEEGKPRVHFGLGVSF